MTIKLKESFKLYDSNNSLAFSILAGEGETLLFIHSDFLSSQWALDGVGINVTLQQGHVSVAIHGLDKTDKMEANARFFCNPYQNWAFDLSEFSRLVLYFRSLGFVIENPNPMGISESVEVKH